MEKLTDLSGGDKLSVVTSTGNAHVDDNFATLTKKINELVEENKGLKKYIKEKLEIQQKLIKKLIEDA